MADETKGLSMGGEWWRGASIYQIYPRSFLDSDGDGVGDLPGITARLEYVASLGVDAIWVSPFFASPMNDFGYDVSNYCDVDPLFGTLADFDALVEAAHALGLKVTIDQVYAHTSDQHPWFSESRADRTNPKADWYVWQNAKADGTPPCNWQSVFGGPAWTWDARRGQYYMHTFLTSQPQLNGHNPEVQDALLDAMRFWLERGVDGFRLDALNHLMFDPAFRDNPPAADTGKLRTRPFDFQEKRYSQSHPGVVGFIEKARTLMDRYGAIFTVAEVGGDNAAGIIADYTRGERRLNSAYGFDFLYASQLTPQVVVDACAAWPGGENDGWPCWAFENHDAPRAISRWAAPGHEREWERLKLAVLLSLRGNVILYQGEELGLRQVEIPFEQLRDPEAIANWPLTLSRDGARTPMPWTAGPGAGFTSGSPWLPVGTDNAARSVAVQERDPDSLLHFTRAALAVRNAHPALRQGAIERCEAAGELLTIVRGDVGERILCQFNFGYAPLTLEVAGGEMLLASDPGGDRVIPPFGFRIVRLPNTYSRNTNA